MATRTRAPSQPWEWVRFQRERAGISRNSMARRLDISEGGYRKWERPPGLKPTFEHLATFCEVTGADLREATKVLYGVTIPGLSNRPFDLLAPVA